MSRHAHRLSRAVTAVTALLLGVLPATPASASTAGGGAMQAARTAPATMQAATTQAAAPAAAAGTVSAGTFTGRGFDTCAAPTTSQMSAWLASPYRAIGVYVGGANRHCTQPNLTASWVTTVTQQGWHLMPLYVGRQAPCVTPPSSSTKISTKPATAASQGKLSADYAAQRMTALGLAPGNPVYLDMENYDRSKPTCVAAVKAFTNAWTVELTKQGYRPGIYGSTSSMMRDLVHWLADDSYHQPKDIWYAHWDGTASTTGEPAIPDRHWSNHQRVHQYRGNIWQSYGGVRLQIDQNQVDAHTSSAAMSIYAGVPHAQLQHSYTHGLRTAGGTAPFTWTVTDGALPKGLRLSQGGTISGTPTVIGRATATVAVTDTKGRRATGTIRLTVDFADVPPRNDFYPDVMWLGRSGITGGYADGDFRPTAQITRQAMAAFLYRYDTDGSPLPACTARPFKDVRIDSTFCPEITWLKSSGITTGYPDGTFHPLQAVSRQAMSAYLSRMVNGSAAPPACVAPRTFWDVPVRNQFCPPITWLASIGVTNGYPDPGHTLPGYHPTAPVSRQAMAAFLHRLAGVQG